MITTIYLDRSGSLQLGPGFPLTQPQDISEIEFYVASKMNEQKQIFLILEDEQGLRDIVELQYVGMSPDGRPFKRYRIAPDCKLRLTTSQVTLTLFTLTIGTMDYHLSNSIKVLLTTSHYNLSREIYIAAELGSKVQYYYEKIIFTLEQLAKNEKGETV